MKTLIVGASGATGKHLVDHLLNKNHQVKIIVRSIAKQPEHWKNNQDLTVIEANVLDISVEDMANHLKDCDAVASCLGHNLTFKGVFGKPRRLVRDSVILLRKAIKKNNPSKPVKFVLMNTIANANRDINEPISSKQKIVIGLLRVLLPPHVDNEQAADYLRTEVGQNDTSIEWSAVRPVTLIDEEKVSEYKLKGSASRNDIFDGGEISRTNVGHFMAELITNQELWLKWKGQMPVIYTKDKE